MAEQSALDPVLVRKIVKEALQEDLAWEDVTCSLLEPPRDRTSASIISMADGVMAGLDVAEAVFLERDRTVSFNALVADGSRVGAGTRVAAVEGLASSLLSSERTALNFLQHLSGIATLTDAFARKVRHAGIKILDTRKTTPLLRPLEKYAVRMGGGYNHRSNLREMILVKENHIRALGGVSRLLEVLDSLGRGIFVEVEVDSIELLERILNGNVNRVMLDNFTPDQVAEAVSMMEEHCRRTSSPRPEIEVSGGIDLDNVSRFAISGVDYISIGSLTHSAPALDLTMEVG